MFRKFFTLAFLTLFLSVGVLFADTYVKKVTHTQAMGQAKDTISEAWYTSNGVVTKNGDVRAIFNTKEKKIIFINDKNKKYAIFNLPIQLPPQMSQMMKMFNMTFKLSPTNETQKIKNWNCKKYVVTSSQGANPQMKISMNMEIWATRDIKIDGNLFQEFNEAMAFSNPMIKNMVAEMRKLNGQFPVKTIITMSMMGRKTTSSSEVTDVSYKPVPKSLFNIPTGYTKIEGNFMQAMQNLNK